MRLYSLGMVIPKHRISIGYTTNNALVAACTMLIDNYQPNPGIIAGSAVNVNIYDIFLVNSWDKVAKKPLYLLEQPRFMQIHVPLGHLRHFGHLGNLENLGILEILEFKMVKMLNMPKMDNMDKNQGGQTSLSPAFQFPN